MYLGLVVVQALPRAILSPTSRNYHGDAVSAVSRSPIDESQKWASYSRSACFGVVHSHRPMVIATLREASQIISLPRNPCCCARSRWMESLIFDTTQNTTALAQLLSLNIKRGQYAARPKPKASLLYVASTKFAASSSSTTYSASSLLKAKFKFRTYSIFTFEGTSAFGPSWSHKS
jgi:hypothetical protein